MNNIIAALKSSPIFNLSLSSKELFHSNFIAWLISEYPKEMWLLFSKYTDLETGKYEIVNDSVDREQKHIDIMFDVIELNGVKNKSQKVIIENKVKSLPYIEQLEKYAKKFPDASCILLTLSYPSHLVTKNRIIKTYGQNWHILTYKEFEKELLSLAINYRFANKIDYKIPVYHKQIIQDYINFINLLDKINQQTEVTHNEKFDWYGTTFKALDEIRLGDFYIKKKCENISQMIFSELSSLKIGDEKSMSISSSIVHSTNGEFRFYYKFNKRVFISIEVSRMYYRKLVYVVNQQKVGKKVKKFKHQFDAENDVFPFFKNIGWFNFDKIPENKKDLSYNSYKDFNSFGDAKYLQCRLNENSIINDIINYFKEDFLFIFEKSDMILNKFVL